MRFRKAGYRNSFSNSLFLFRGPLHKSCFFSRGCYNYKKGSIFYATRRPIAGAWALNPIVNAEAIMKNNRGSLYLSVVAPVCGEEECLEELCSRLFSVLAGLSRTFEVIFVNNDRYGRNCSKLYSLAAVYPGFSVIESERRRDQAAATLEGIKRSSGKYIVTIDADMQNDPGDITVLIEALRKGNDLACGWRRRRNDPVFRKCVSFLSNRVYAFFTGYRLKDYNCGLNALNASLADRLIALGDRGRFIKQALVLLAGSVAEVEVKHHSRLAGKSKYSMAVIIWKGLDFIVNFRAARFLRYRKA